jgi:hypothetical protein
VANSIVLKYSIAIIGILAAAIAVFGRAGETGWIGVSVTADAGKSGLRILAVVYDSPADKAGLLIGDVITGLDSRQFPDFVSHHAPGDTITLKVIRGGESLNVPVTVGKRPDEKPVKDYSAAKNNWPEEQLASSLIDEYNIRPAYEDLRGRLLRLSQTGDPFRLSRVAYVQREPFQLRTIAGHMFDEIASAMDPRNPRAIFRLAAEWLDKPISAASPLKTGLTLEQHLDQLIDVLREAGIKREQAFAQLTTEDRQFFENNCDAVFRTFSESGDLESAEDRDTQRRNARLLQIAARVDFVRLFEGAELMWRTSDDIYLNDLESALKKAWEAAGKPEGIFIDRDSPVGKILVGGNGSTWYREDAAILLDLAGNDFYTNNAGSTRSNLPSALLIDFAGDDAYEATFDWAQASARMGYSVLIDRKGNDEYIGQSWTQGAAVLGAALLLDESGNDIYRAAQYAQGTAAWGIGLHIDYEGDDTYDARLLSQAVGLPGGAGWLLDAKGNDTYYSKGERPTSYGNLGIFDSWSQASAIGFRHMQSGGVAVLYDGAGRDRYEAGNFSQGGGYYFGIGMFRDAGSENDMYIGSHYNQGFAAHQAIGFFEDIGGNDFYTARHAVAQGTAWDEAIAVFIDHAGDDVYEGGETFSQGASAHNGFCLFLDLGGRNRFTYGLPQGSAGPNDYHGGHSFSLFVAANANGNTYSSNMSGSTKRLNGDYGFFVDAAGPIEGIK